ncbi:MAG: uroporphyrinogen-III synthase [Sphingomonas sp.]|nr:uroporphyrinogen-III synthase [Sphingomonas sp.]
MSAPLLILRPQPGADRTAARARARGLATVIAPLFTVRPLAWTAPEGSYDAVMLTSANAARHAGDGLTPYLKLPCHAVGETTAEAAREAGFLDVITGPADGGALMADMAGAGIRSALWPCGLDRATPDDVGIRIAAVPVYVAEPIEFLPPEADAALRAGAVALLHSRRAAACFAALAAAYRRTTRVAALSEAVAQAAGDGWAGIAAADRPRDEALLELAAKLCQTDREMRPPHA